MAHKSQLAEGGILAYLELHERKEMLRFLTCGSVDDGKSTLIGRLLHDSQLVYEDHLAVVNQDSTRFGTTGGIDLALLVDGLQAEREQGITIDVAYRYFSTLRRKFIIADTPGHEQYTRNMATGASTCDLAIILIDARKGVLTQTRRHSFIVSLLGIRHMLVAVNKMDLAGYSEEVFHTIRREYVEFLQALGQHDVWFIPISALDGDNVVNPSRKMPWYQGQPLMELLETIEIVQDRNFSDMRLPVQYVNRPNRNFRGYSGTLAAGVLRPGDAVMALPSHKTSRVKSIVTYDGELAEAFPPQAVTVTLEDEIDVSRGDLLVRAESLPWVDTRLLAHIVWMAEEPMATGKQYYLKQAAKVVTGSVSQVQCRIDINTLERHPADQLLLNEIGLCEVALSGPLAFDPYSRCKATGSFILIDRITHGTVGAGMIIGPVGPAETAGTIRRVTQEERAARFGQRAVTIWLRGEDARDLARRLERSLFDLGQACAVLEEEGLTGDVRELVARHVTAAGLICLCPLERPSLAAGIEDAANWCVDVRGLEVEEVLQLLQQRGVLRA